MKRFGLLVLSFILVSISAVVNGQGMPDYVIRTAQEINARYGQDTIDMNNVGWDYRGGAIGDNFNLLEGCTNPVTLPSTTTATSYYRVFFDSDVDGDNDWTIITYGDYSYFGECAIPRYECGILPPRLTIGGQGYVEGDGFPNNLRSEPGESGNLIGEIPAGAQFSVVDGPQCGSNISFWQVNYNGTIGWTAEGQGTSYYLVPGVPTAPVVPDNVGPTPTFAPTTVPVYQCNGVRSRIYSGQKAQVTPGIPNNLRSQAGESGQLLGEIPPGIPFDVIDGPQCNGGLQWWQVNYNGTIGWTAEAGSPDDYWLEPVITGLVPISPQNVNQIAPIQSFTAPAPETIYITGRSEILTYGNNIYSSWSLANPAASPQDYTWVSRDQMTFQGYFNATWMDNSGIVHAIEVPPQVAETPKLYDDITLLGGRALENMSFGAVVFGASYSPSGQQIVVAPQGTGLAMLDVSSPQTLPIPVTYQPRILLPDEIIGEIKFSDTGNRMIALSEKGNAVIWNTEGDDISQWAMMYVVVLGDEQTSVREVALSPDGSQLAVAGLIHTTESESLGYAQIWTLQDEQAVQTASVNLASGSAIEAVKYTADGTMIVAGGKMLHFLDATNLTLLHSVTIATDNSVFEVAFNSTGTLMATVSFDQNLTIWHIP